MTRGNIPSSKTRNSHNFHLKIYKLKNCGELSFEKGKYMVFQVRGEGLKDGGDEILFLNLSRDVFLNVLSFDLVQ